jgi:3-phosphoshikimate 1-carboxyvinyltransferase
MKRRDFAAAAVASAAWGQALFQPTQAQVAKPEAGADYLRVEAPSALLPGAAIDTYDDHRIAMCFSLAALGGVPVRINDPDCVAKTFPDYFDVFASITA